MDDFADIKNRMSLNQSTLARDTPQGGYPQKGDTAMSTQHNYPALNICLIPRNACRVRSSFSISENRTCPSPCSPNPTPGLTATLASSSSFFENSTDPIPRYCSGIRAHANIVALGSSTGHPSLFSPGTSTSRRAL